MLLADTLALKQVDPADFDGAFYPGGYGTMWDLAEDTYSAALIAEFGAFSSKRVTRSAARIRSTDADPSVN